MHGEGERSNTVFADPIKTVLIPSSDFSHTARHGKRKLSNLLSNDMPTTTSTITEAQPEGQLLAQCTASTFTTAPPKAQLLTMPPEIIVEIASYLYERDDQVYIFTKRDDNSWLLRMRDVPWNTVATIRPRRYGCRTLFPTRPPRNKGLLATRVAFSSTHPRFESLLETELPPKLAKPILPEPLEVWDEQLLTKGKPAKLDGKYWYVSVQGSSSYLFDY